MPSPENATTTVLAPERGVVLVTESAVRRKSGRGLRALQNLTDIAEAFPPDGGSRIYFFYMHPPERQMLALLVRHRTPAPGGNADFQEIWLDRGGGFGTHTDVQAGSPLEAKLLQLLRTATIQTNVHLDFITRPPNPDHLKWVAERIQDRKTKW